MSRNRKVQLVLLVAVFGILLFALWPKKRESEIPGILLATPGGAAQVFYVDLARLRDSGFLSRLSSLAPAVTADEEYTEFVRSTGFDYTKDLDRVLMVLGDERPIHPFFLAEGRFDQKKIARHALQSGGAEQHEEFEMFVVPGEEGSESLSLAFLWPDRIALGKGARFSEWLRRERLADADPEMFQQLLRVSGSAAFLVGRPAPERASDSGGVQSPQLQQILRSIRWYAVAVVPQREQLVVVADLTCSTDRDCSELAEALEGLRTLALAALLQPKPPLGITPRDADFLRELLSRARISTQGSTVRTRVQIDAAWFADESAARP